MVFQLFESSIPAKCDDAPRAKTQEMWRITANEQTGFACLHRRLLAVFTSACVHHSALNAASGLMAIDIRRFGNYRHHLAPPRNTFDFSLLFKSTHFRLCRCSPSTSESGGQCDERFELWKFQKVWISKCSLSLGSSFGAVEFRIAEIIRKFDFSLLECVSMRFHLRLSVQDFLLKKTKAHLINILINIFINEILPIFL